MIDCATATDLLLVGEPAELRGEGDSDLAAHVRACASCRDQAAGDRHVMLAYLIEMAYVEASDLLRRLNDEKKAG